MATQSKVTLDRHQMIHTLAYWFGRPGFPDALRIVLEDTFLRRVGDVRLIDEPGCEEESDMACVTADIDQLVLDLPSLDAYKAHFAQKFGDRHLFRIPEEALWEFWANYPLRLADRVGEIQLVWE